MRIEKGPDWTAEDDLSLFWSQLHVFYGSFSWQVSKPAGAQGKAGFC